MSENLKDNHCTPCEEGGQLLTEDQLYSLMGVLDANWRIVDGHHLTRAFRFEDFKEALEFTNAVGEIAEKEGHHPDIHLSWGRVVVELWTHKSNGLTKNDFVLAIKIDNIS